jgi:hypothetical protein
MKTNPNTKSKTYRRGAEALRILWFVIPSERSESRNPLGHHGQS